MLRNALTALVALAMVALSLTSVRTANAVAPINFTRGVLAGAGFSTTNPSALAAGPDGRVYVADTNGRIQALTLDPTTKAVTAVQQLSTNTDLQEVFGMAFDPTDGSLWVTNTVSGFGDAGQASPNSFPGKITRFAGPTYTTHTDVITGLPISNSGHEANDLAFGPDGRLYIEQGSSTNAGVINPVPGLFQLQDTPLSAAILVADVHNAAFNGAITYSANVYAATTTQTGGDVSVYAPGFRNPYGMVFHSNGFLYATDNGPNAGYGSASVTCNTDAGGDAAGLDELDLVFANHYYGHANRNRGRTDARQCTYHYGIEPSGPNYDGPIEANLPASSDGMIEYRSGVFGGQMQGDLLYAAWVNNELHRVKLSADGLSVVSDTTLASGLQNALDVAATNDGTIFVAEYGASRITFLKPDTSAVTGITVTGVIPGGGPTVGGQAITISGTNFTTTADTTATIDGAAVTNLVVQNSGTITGRAPAALTGTGAKDVTVTNSVGTATKTGAYIYATGGGTLPPVANAGPDVVTPIAHLDHAHVTLDARGSTDADGFIVSYLWTENGVTLSTNIVDSLEFKLGTHVVDLTVTDNDGFTSTDELRITVTATALNPEPFYCADENGDGIVNSADLQQVAQAFGRRFSDPPNTTPKYSRLKDWNADRLINSADLMGTAQDFSTTSAGCPLVDRQIRAATAAMEKYQNVNVAIADGYTQVTPFIPGQGRHMIKGGLAGLGRQDAIFDPAQPESLLYERDSSTPGGWRLGGAMYIVPITISPIPPDGFQGTDDSWHYHDGLCIYGGGTGVAENTLQADCVNGGGVWIEKAGWLVHLWNYVPNFSGRFVEINSRFMGLP